MDDSDDEFLRELEAAFQIEAQEHLQVLSSGLLELEASPTPVPALLETIFREAHSLKGAARAVNRTEVEAVCQSLETVLAAWKRHEIVPDPGLFDALHQALDLAAELLGGAGDAAADKQRVSAVTRRLSHVGSPISPTGAEESAPVLREKGGGDGFFDSPALPSLTGPGAGGTGSAETVRISVAKLDALLLQAEEMLAVKQAAGQRTADLREAQAEAQRALGNCKRERSALARETLPDRTQAFLESSQNALQSLSGSLSALAKSAEQDGRDIRRKVDALLEDTKRLMLLPVSTLLAAFPKMVRDLAREEGKEVALVLRGGGVEMDKRILEAIKDPLIHLLRNSVDHGVEAPEERAGVQKASRATVTLTVTQVSGSEVEILIADDGAGIDTARVKASAVRHGVITEEAAGQMGEAEALDLIFASQISTSPIITEISGRGLGMAIVREKVEKLGGRIQIATQRGQGTSFRLLLPLTLATFKGVLVRVADQVFVLPTADVASARRLRSGETQTVENRETILWEGRLVPLVSLHDVLELPRQERRADSAAPALVVVLGTAEKRIAFEVDAILDEQEVLVKPLGKPLLRVRNVAGATVLGSGKPAAVLNVADLLKSAAKVAAAPRPLVPPKKSADTRRKSILLAEDSITSRMLLKNILESAGYEVTTAVDGLDALTTLKTQAFSLVVSDVDMPRLNGLDLTAKIREDPIFGEIPVVLVTARDTREDRERGVDVGASAYLVKSSFDQSNLLAVVQRLI